MFSFQPWKVPQLCTTMGVAGSKTSGRNFRRKDVVNLVPVEQICYADKFFIHFVDHIAWPVRDR